MIVAVTILFWLALAWLLYVFVGYPLVMWIIARLRPRPVDADASYRPRVAFVMAAYNEAANIRQRIDNYLSLEYPRELLEFHIGSDGSTDGTDDIIREYAARDASIHLTRYERCGKTRIVYELAAAVDAEVIVFTDADVVLDPASLAHAVACFADERVGGVVCRVEHYDRRHSAGSAGERKFVAMENSLRANESLVWTTVAPTGPCYAVRRGAYTPLRDYRLSDDTNLSITIPLNGRRVWYEPRFLLYETTRRSIWTEVRRRLRMGQQSTATFLAFDRTRYPWRSWVGFEIWSHKLLRNLAAIPAGLLGLSSIVLALMTGEALHETIAIVCVGWLLVIGFGALCEWLELNFPIVLYPLYFTAMVVSLTIGSVRAAFSGGLAMWTSQRVE